MHDESIRTWFERLVRIHQWGQAEQLVSAEARELWHGNRRVDAVELARDCAVTLLRQDAIGEAADLYSLAASWLVEQGLHVEAAHVYRSFADELIARGLYGWAASRYYDAAMTYAARAQIRDARAVLEAAAPRFLQVPGEQYWRDRFTRDLAILGGGNGDVDKLMELERAFRRDGRDDWARSCQNGIAFLATGQIAKAV